MNDKALMEQLNPIELSRILRRAEEARSSWRNRLKVEPSLEDLPLQLFRSTLLAAPFLEIKELPEYDPLRKPLLRWMFRLLEQRINQQWLVHIHQERYVVEHSLTEPSRQSCSLAGMLNEALVESSERDSWCKALQANAQRLNEAHINLWQRRQELATRLELASPDELELPGADLVDEAKSWLERTQALAAEFRPSTLSAWLRLLDGKRALADWPAQLRERDLADWFRSTQLLESLDLRTPALPKANGPASFMRGLAILGAGIQRASAPADQPFVIGRDPGKLSEHISASLFAGLLLNRAFMKRELGLSSAKEGDVLRELSVIALLETRLRAIKVLLRNTALTSSKQINEEARSLVADHLGPSLAEHALGVVFQLRSDDPQAFAASFCAHSHSINLTEAHEADWYRNPRAIDQLRSEAALPPETEVDLKAVKRGQIELATSFARALG